MHNGLISPCCANHYKALPYGECPKHPKITFDGCTSLIAITYNTKHEALTLTMFHDFTWYDKSLNNHLNNNLIFESFPINVDQFYKGNLVPDYTVFDKPMATAFVDIHWLFPRQQHSLYIGNWDMKTPYYNLKPIKENWNNVVTFVQKRLLVKSQLCEMQHKIADSEYKAQVCVIVSIFAFCLFFVFFIFFGFFVFLLLGIT